MTNSEKEAIAKLGGAIGDYYRAEAAKGNKGPLPRPAILDEEPPTDPGRLPGWRALREQVNDEYIGSLMNRSSLNRAEQQYLAAAIGRALKESGTDK